MGLGPYQHLSERCCFHLEEDLRLGVNSPGWRPGRNWTSEHRQEADYSEVGPKLGPDLAVGEPAEGQEQLVVQILVVDQPRRQLLDKVEVES